LARIYNTLGKGGIQQADSKGKYIEREVITEHCLKVKSMWKKGWKIQDCINWAKNNLTTIFEVCAKCYQILFFFFSSVREKRVFSLLHMHQNVNIKF
jgi:hypothetical protein